MPFVHKLVAIHFIENTYDKEEVNHIDHDKLNCDMTNLEWCTRKENMNAMSVFYRKNKDLTKIKFREQKHCECLSCGVNISSTTKTSMCPKCYSFSSRKTQRPNKEELLELIKTYSFLELSRIYNVSDNAIRKWCKKYGLPFKRKDIEKIL